MPRDLLAAVFSAAHDEPVIAALETLARDKDHATALLLELLPDPVYAADGLVFAEVWPEILTRSREEFAKERAALEKRCLASPRPIEVRALEVQARLAGADAAIAARHADITVMLRPEGSEMTGERRAIFEEVLFGSGRPVLLIPPGWKRDVIGRNVVIGWNAKREAARALADALPLLEAASRVTIVTVDAKPSLGGHGDHPGADIAAHLARKGLNAALRNIDGLGREEGDALLAEARALEADLIVIGGYGRARLREFVFGGVTRTMTQTTTLPLLISH